MGIANPFNKATGMAGRDWLSQFMKRHAALSIRAPIATSLARINGFNSHAIEHFFVVLKSVLQSGSFNALNIWNCDETGFSSVARVCKVVSTKGARQVRKVSRAERGANITALCCMNAAGTYVPPLFVREEVHK